MAASSPGRKRNSMDWSPTDCQPSPSHSKSSVDDSLLSKIMDLEDLEDQAMQEQWLAAGAGAGAGAAADSGHPFFSFSPSSLPHFAYHSPPLPFPSPPCSPGINFPLLMDIRQRARSFDRLEDFQQTGMSLGTPIYPGTQANPSELLGTNRSVPSERFYVPATEQRPEGRLGVGDACILDRPHQEESLYVANFVGNGEPTSQAHLRNWGRHAPNTSLCSGLVTFSGRIELALSHYLRLTRGDVLAQVWIPLMIGKRSVLTTHGQPFALRHPIDHLSTYRRLSSKYLFSADHSDPEAFPGLPGRVFLKKTPEWTPNVQFYKKSEYLRVNDAERCNVRGSLAVPVFERSTGICVAVVELIMSSEEMNYGSEMESLLCALQEVNLYSSERHSYLPVQIHTEGRQAVLSEISEVLMAVCETHKLPLAQTWVPCVIAIPACNMARDSSLGDLGSYGVNRIGLCTGDGPCCVIDLNVKGFRQACSEHCLEKEQGVPGKAFVSNQPFFSSDVKDYSKAEYPLGHYARVFQLAAAVAIRLRSVHTADNDYVLEFFLPQTCSDSAEQQLMLNAVSMTMQRVCRSLRTLSIEEFKKERADCNAQHRSDGLGLHGSLAHNDGVVPRMQGSHISFEDDLDNQFFPMRNEVRLVGDNHPEKPAFKTESDEAKWKSLPGCDFDEPIILAVTEHSIPYQEEVPKPSGSHDNDINTLPSVQNLSACVQETASNRRQLDKKQGTMEKTISLNVLQQYFTGNLKDAAKSIGVCPTTLKRICRQHGISRWPSRKIKKVSRSLEKIKGVINSVQGADMALQISAAITGDLASAAAAVKRVRMDDIVPGVKAGGSATSLVMPAASIPGQVVSASSQGLSLDCVFVAKEEQSKGSIRIEPSEQVSSTACGGKAQGGTLTSEHSGSGNSSSEKDGNKWESRVHGGLAAFTALTSVPADSSLPRDRMDGHDSPSCCVELNTDAAVQTPDEEISGHEANHRGSHDRADSFPQFDSSSLQGSDTGSPSLSAVGSSQRGRRALQEVPLTTVKAKFRDDTARFKLGVTSGFSDVQEEVAKRFKLKMDSFGLKYLDEDDEWVMLTCDEDVTECIDVLRTSGGNHVKLMVCASTTYHGSSCGSTGGP